MARALSLTKLSLIIAAAYVLSGRLGLLLAIPPGYATAIFPPAGVALGALLLSGHRALLGVWLGSLILNIWIGGGVSPFSLLIAALIASGSTLQAWVGRWLIHRFIGTHFTFEEGRTQGLFALLAGCVATLIGASVGTVSLWVTGLFSSTNAVAFGWLTWWVGDGIGVLLIAPLMLMMWGDPAEYWRPLVRKVMPIMAITLIIVVSTFYAASHWEQANLRESFARASERVGNQIESGFSQTITELESLERFFAASEQVDHLLDSVKPRLLIFDEFHSALRGRRQDVKAIFSFLRRIARVHDISPVLVGEIAVYDALHDTEEMGSRFDTVAVPRWGFDEDFATLLDSLEASMPLAHASNLSRPPLAKMIHDLSEGLIGEVVDIVTRAAVAAAETGEERITSSTVMALGYVPLSRRRNSALRHSMT